MSRLQPTPRTTLKRGADRGTYDRESIHGILDEGLICHLAFHANGSPHVIPTAYGRDGDQVYVHGAAANRALRALCHGEPACLTVTLVDGLVLARSAFHQSMNYRSVILYGGMREVTEPDERVHGLQVMIEHMVPGRWKDVRGPNETELKRTLVLALRIDEGSAKVRSGPPVDDDEDHETSCWAGVIPSSTRFSAPVNDPLLRADIGVPEYVQGYGRGNGGAR
jgi:hypothetical protein